MISAQPYKGTRDFYPEEFDKRAHIFDTWRKTLIENGFVEYDASVIENAQLYIEKSGNELGSKQLYSFEDKGGRKIALRPEMTPTLARIVSNKYEELLPSMPLKWFSIPNCFRYERPQKGRTREFWQLNADIIGASAGVPDVELMVALGKMFDNFGASKEMYTIKYNHRGLLDQWIVEGLRIDSIELKQDIYNFLDSYNKLNPTDEDLSSAQWHQSVVKKLEIIDKEHFDQQLVKKIVNLINKKGEEYKSYQKLQTNFPELNMLQSVLENSCPNTNYEFDPTIVRGLAYYTGLVFECFDNNPDNNRAMFGGGRYDDLLDLFGKEAKCVGVGVGDLTFYEFLDGWSLWPENTTNELVGVMIETAENLEDKLNSYYNITLPEIIKSGKSPLLDYDFLRAENKRYKSLKKRGCDVIIKI